MAGILNLIASTWESILPDLAKSVNEPSLELVQQTVTGESEKKNGRKDRMLLCYFGVRGKDRA